MLAPDFLQSSVLLLQHGGRGSSGLHWVPDAACEAAESLQLGGREGQLTLTTVRGYQRIVSRGKPSRVAGCHARTAL